MNGKVKILLVLLALLLSQSFVKGSWAINLIFESNAKLAESIPVRNTIRLCGVPVGHFIAWYKDSYTQADFSVYLNEIHNFSEGLVKLDSQWGFNKKGELTLLDPGKNGEVPFDKYHGSRIPIKQLASQKEIKAALKKPCPYFSKKQIQEMLQSERVAQILSKAFDTGDISQLWKILGKNTTVMVYWEHSLGEDDRDNDLKLKGAVEVKKWMKNLHKTYRPEVHKANERRHIVKGTVKSCYKVGCHFFPGMIMHNHLYLKAVVLEKDKKGKLIVKKIHVYDGN